MMNWSGHWGGGWWVVMCLMMMALLVAAAWVAVALTRRSGKAGPSSAQEILEERLARGDISVAEFEERRAVLATTSRGPTPPDRPA